MIDTVKFRLHGGLSWRNVLEMPAEYEIQDNVRQRRRYDKFTDTMEDLEECGRMVHSRETGLRVWGQIDAPEWVEVSLPRLFYGRNGILLKDDAEIDAALALLEDSVMELCSCEMELRGVERNIGLFLHCTRVDLCWQFEGEIEKWIQALRLLGHPRVRRPTVIHGGSGLVFPGVGVHIRIYDKHKEEFRRPGNVVRVETQLRGVALQEMGLRDLDDGWASGFGYLWKCFKDLVLQFNPVRNSEINGTAELLSALEAEGVVVGGQTAFEMWAAGKHRSTVSRMRNAMRDRLPKRCEIDLWDLMRVPVPVDVMPECHA